MFEKSEDSVIDETIDIGAVTAHTGLAPSTLHYYEERNLIRPVGRRGLRRQYDPEVLDRLALLTMAQDAGFSLEEIASMLAEGDAGLSRTELRSKANELDETIAQIAAMRDNLRHMAECPEPNHLECPKFLGLVRAGFARRGGRPTS